MLPLASLQICCLPAGSGVDEEGLPHCSDARSEEPFANRVIRLDGSQAGGVLFSDDFLGTANGTTTRMKGGKTVELPSFLAQRMHTASYGGVDRIGRGSWTKMYGITFTLVPWFKHLIATTINLHTHAT